MIFCYFSQFLSPTLKDNHFALNQVSNVVIVYVWYVQKLL